MENKELLNIDNDSVLAVFSSGEGLDPYVQQARDIVDSFEHDLSTDAGRKRTASLANKVAKLKVRLDDLGKELVSDWKQKAKAVDVNRKSMRDALDSLKLEARKPLTEWEEEQERIAAEKAAAEEAERIRKEIESDWELAILMNEKIDRDRKEEAERLERERVEREEAMKREAAEKARKEAEEKAASEKARIEQEKRDAEERAKEAERQRIAAEERAKIEAEQAEKRRIEAEEKAKRDAEEAAERAKQQQIAEQKAKEDAEKAEQERREANKRHVGGIRKAAKESLMAIGIDEALAKEIVMAINDGKIKNITINY